MKIRVCRSGAEIGSYDYLAVVTGLKEGLFQDTDYGWIMNMGGWLELPLVVLGVDAMKNRTASRGEAATRNQLRFLKNRYFPHHANITKFEASRLIRKMPINYRKLTGSDIDLLTADGRVVSKLTYEGCVIRLARSGRRQHPSNLLLPVAIGVGDRRIAPILRGEEKTRLLTYAFQRAAARRNPGHFRTK